MSTNRVQKLLKKKKSNTVLLNPNLYNYYLLFPDYI